MAFIMHVPSIILYHKQESGTMTLDLDLDHDHPDTLPV
jgi:hypothetical protein